MGRVYKEYFLMPPYDDDGSISHSDDDDEEEADSSSDEERGESNSNEAIYVCQQCQTHLSRGENIVSRAFVGSHGTAFLFNHVINVSFGESFNSTMRTGLHKIQRVYCIDCRNDLGWKYIVAFESEQKYKEGMVVLEKNLIVEKLFGGGAGSGGSIPITS